MENLFIAKCYIDKSGMAFNLQPMGADLCQHRNNNFRGKPPVPIGDFKRKKFRDQG
jgi:hypothetical protein